MHISDYFCLIQHIFISGNLAATAATLNVDKQSIKNHEPRSVSGTQATLKHQQNVIKLQQVSRLNELEDLIICYRNYDTIMYYILLIYIYVYFINEATTTTTSHTKAAATPTTTTAPEDN